MAHRRDVDRALNARDEANRLESRLGELRAQRPLQAPAVASASSSPGALGAGAVLVVAGVVGALLWQPLAGLVSLAGLALMWLGWIQRSRRTPADRELSAFEGPVRDLEHQVVAAKAKAETLSIKDDADLRTERSELGRAWKSSRRASGRKPPTG